MKRFYCIMQHDSMECGIACLAMICNYYGKTYSIGTLSKICNVSTEGVSLYAIRSAALILGLHTESAKTSIKAFYEMGLPCIIHWNQNHFVVLYKIKHQRKFYIADPAKGHRVLSLEEFNQGWISSINQGEGKGIAMFLEPTPSFYKQNQNSDDAKNTRSFRFILSYIHKYRRSFAIIIFGLFLSCIIQFALPFLTQSIVDIGINDKDINIIWLILLGQLMLVLGRTIIDFSRHRILLRINVSINISLVYDFFIKLMKLPMSFFDTKLLGDLMQRMNDHNRVNTFLTQQMLSIIFSIITLIVFSVVLFFYNSLVFCVFLMGSILYGGWMVLFLQRRKRIDYELFEHQTKNNNKTYEFISSIQEIKLQDCEQRKIKDWEEVQSGLFNVQMKSLRLQQNQESGSVLINEIKNIIITVVAATAVIDGNITLGMMLAIQYIIGQLNSPVEQLMLFFYSLQDVMISLERINEIHDVEEEDGEKELLKVFPDISQGILLNHAMFKYDPYALQKNIEDVSIHIKHGEVTAIVGSSGSGKTTLIKLILGYYPLLEGELCICGTNINTINKKWWRQQCGVVMQDGVIFSESIARNIAVDDSDINYERLLIAAEIACIKEFIMSLPLNFDTKIGRDGIGLSQGQKQRILIARAAYKNPDYIFLDEATNSLDANNERKIVENLNNFYAGKTVIIVAHRLSTVQRANTIVVLDKGIVSEQGSHQELISRHGTYYNLVKNQLNIDV